jgi:hypothetical protein
MRTTQTNINVGWVEETKLNTEVVIALRAVATGNSRL